MGGDPVGTAEKITMGVDQDLVFNVDCALYPQYNGHLWC